MTSNARPSRQSGKIVQLRKGASLEMVRLACPDSAQASLISESFGLPVIDSDGIRDLHHKIIVETAESLNEGLGDRAMRIHLQRIVGSYVGSAHGARPCISDAFAVSLLASFDVVSRRSARIGDELARPQQQRRRRVPDKPVRHDLRPENAAGAGFGQPIAERQSDGVGK